MTKPSHAVNASTGTFIQCMQKALGQMNLQLPLVASAIDSNPMQPAGQMLEDLVAPVWRPC